MLISRPSVRRWCVPIYRELSFAIILHVTSAFTCHRPFLSGALLSHEIARSGSDVEVCVELKIVFAQQQQTETDFKCPKNGNYPDPYQCDLYYHCFNGEAEERLCPDGLVFDDTSITHERCDIPVNVDCGERKDLQEPKPTKGCPRANGIYRHYDSQVCDKFINCVDGKLNELPCPPGLVYDDAKSNCAWPTDSLRKDCTNTKRETLPDGFSCPVTEEVSNGRVLPHPTYAHPEDCQKFYICRNGVTPQYGSCSPGSVYNELTYQCDDPENVKGCENWYETEEDKKGETKKP